MAPTIREARPEDAPALVGLERLSPEVGRITFRIDVQPNDWPVLLRYPDTKGHVAPLAPTRRSADRRVPGPTNDGCVRGLSLIVVAIALLLGVLAVLFWSMDFQAARSATAAQLVAPIS